MKRVVLIALTIATLGSLAGCYPYYRDGYYRDGYYNRGYYGSGAYGRHRDGYEYNRGYYGDRRNAPYADYDYGYDR